MYMQGMCDLLTSFAPACGIGDAVMMLLGLCMCLGQLVVDHGASERVDTISSCVVSAQRLEHAEVCVCVMMDAPMTAHAIWPPP